MIPRKEDDGNMTAREVVSGLVDVAKLVKIASDGFDGYFKDRRKEIRVATVGEYDWRTKAPYVQLYGEEAPDFIIELGGERGPIIAYQDGHMPDYRFEAMVDGVLVCCLTPVPPCGCRGGEE